MASQARTQAQPGAGRPPRGGRSRPVPLRPGAPLPQASHRLLVLRGMTPDEAANLIAFCCGIRVGEQRWTLAEVNRLLFLRELTRVGRIGGPQDMANTGP